MLNKILFGSDIQGAAWANLGFTLLRIFTGIGMMTHGIGKVPPAAGFVETVTKLGFPMPTMFAWAAGLSELAGGALLLIGLLTRPAAFFVLITMLVAAFGFHYADPFGKKELSLFYSFLALFFLLAGGGDWSVDALLRRGSGGKKKR